MEILRRGSEGNDVRNWQHFLLGLGLLVDSSVDGVFGPRTEAATKAFQKKHQLVQDGMVGPRTYAAAIAGGFDPGFTDPLGGTSGPDWPPPPNFRPLISNLERQEVFGRFDFRRRTPGRDDIVIRGDWEARNIVSITVPQLRGVKGAPASGRIRVHKLVREQAMGLFQAWEDDGLLKLLKTWEGSFVPRYVRGSSVTLSNHAWGTAFDINYPWNPLGRMPALRGQPGSVRELVPRAHQFGFYWGGHFSRRDGMHFEVARVLG
jgi:peptidoglycan hydrolase-like protein with peptidoglycan-binding domain